MIVVRYAVPCLIELMSVDPPGPALEPTRSHLEAR